MIVPSVSRATRNRTGVIDHHAAAPAGAVSQGLVVASPLSVTHTAESEGKGEGGGGKWEGEESWLAPKRIIALDFSVALTCLFQLDKKFTEQLQRLKSLEN